MQRLERDFRVEEYPSAEYLENLLAGIKQPTLAVVFAEINPVMDYSAGISSAS